MMTKEQEARRDRDRDDGDRELARKRLLSDDEFIAEYREAKKKHDATRTELQRILDL